MKKDNPCIDCQDAGFKTGKGCGKHATCEQYKAYFQKNQDLQKARGHDAVLKSYVFNSIKRARESAGIKWKRKRISGGQ